MTGVLASQVRHELVGLLRTPITLILSVGFPLLFYVLISAFVGNQTIDERQGVRLAQLLAGGFASFGLVMATFSFLAVGFAEARATGVLKRIGGTPLPRWVLLGGRTGAAMLLGLAATVLVVAAGVVFYDVRLIGRSAAAVVVVLLLAGAAFSALGLAAAALLPNPQTTLAVTNGVVVPLSFISDVFMFGGTLPGWMATLGWVFPLKHLVALLQDAFNPYLTGSGFQADHLAVITVWGVAGALVAAWGLRRERDRSTSVQARRRAPARDAEPRRTARPSVLALTLEQVRHGQAVLWRDPSSVFFAVVFPVLLVALIPTVNGGGDLVLDDGQLLGAFFGATMAVYGAAVTAYVNMPQGLAEDRERGVLKRLHAAPVPAGAVLVGRVVAALVVALITLGAVWVLVGLVYGIGLPTTWPVAVLVLVASTVCFASVGLAVICVVRSAQAVIGVALGTLLPLCFISDVFVVGAPFPPVLDAIAWFFPLRHATRAMTEVVAGGALDWSHLAVIALWTSAGLAVVAWRFSWVDGDRRPAARGPARQVVGAGAS